MLLFTLSVFCFKMGVYSAKITSNTYNLAIGCNSVVKWVFRFQNNLKDLDLSYKMAVGL